MTYYAQRKSIKDGAPVTPNNRYGTREEMLRQYFLYCASAATNADGNEFDTIEFGTIEQGALKVERFAHEQPEPEPEPEPDTEPEA
jgi:hypothetical protein